MTPTTPPAACHHAHGVGDEPFGPPCVVGELESRASSAAATVPAPPPPRVPAYLAKRRAIDALWAEADALWDAATESERDAMVTGLGDDWRPLR